MISCLACLRSSATRKAEERSGSGSRLYGVTTPNQMVTRKRHPERVLQGAGVFNGCSTSVQRLFSFWKGFGKAGLV